MQAVDLPPSLGGGVIVLGVAPAGPAERAGIMVGDIITTMKGRRVSASEDVQAVLDAGSVGTSIVVGVVRGGRPAEINVTIAERPRPGDD